MHFIINFEVSLVNFLNVFGFLLLTSEKNGGNAFLICYFLAINIYCFFDDCGTWLLLLEYSLWFVQVSTVFERLFKCYFAVPISLTRKFRKKHTHTLPCFSLKNHGQSFFLNHLFLPFNSRINRGFYFLRIVPTWRISWNFTLLLQSFILQNF